MKLIEILKRRREDLGLSHREVSELAGLGGTNYGKYERGELTGTLTLDPDDPGTLDRFFDVLKIRVCLEFDEEE